jgi:hypothetical protein
MIGQAKPPPGLLRAEQLYAQFACVFSEPDTLRGQTEKPSRFCSIRHRAPDKSIAPQVKAPAHGATRKAEANAVAGGAPNRPLRSDDACGAMSRNGIIQSGLTGLPLFTPCRF